MNLFAIRLAPFLISIDLDEPRIACAQSLDACEIAATCERVLGLQDADFPRQGSSKDEAHRAAGLVLRLLGR